MDRCAHRARRSARSWIDDSRDVLPHRCLAFPPAQAWPDQAAPHHRALPAGQSTDILARVMADQLTKALGQQVIVENRPGAGGSIGADVAAKAAPDGYTLLMVTISTHVIAPALYPKLPYDPLKDFAPITNVGLTPQVLMASLKSGITSVKELIAKAKAGGDSITAPRATARRAIWRSSMLTQRRRHQAHARALQGQCRRPARAAERRHPAHVRRDPWRRRTVRSGKVTAIGIADTNARPICPTSRPSSSRACRASSPSAGSASRRPPTSPAPILDRLECRDADGS